jgi:hypothetical protein
LEGVDKYGGNIEKLVACINQSPLQIRLKACARAITALKHKGSYTDDHKISWFNNCIRPSLSVSQQLNIIEFESEEILTIKELCDFNGPHLLNE